MRTINEYMSDIQAENDIIFEVNQLFGEDMVLEKFNSTLLSSLAKKIAEYDKAHINKLNDEIKNASSERQKRDCIFYKKASSIFAPTYARHHEKKPMAIKFSDIKDEDFKKYDGKDEKEVEKMLTDAFDSKTEVFIIAFIKGTKSPKYVLKISKDDNVSNGIVQWKRNTAHNNIQFFTFIDEYGEDEEPAFIEKRRKTKGGYSEAEVAKLFNKCDVYVLTITDAMKKEYDLMFNQRTEEKKGMINLDKDSLDDIKYKNQQRYRQMARELKFKKVSENTEKFKQELFDLNDEIFDLGKKIVRDYHQMDLVHRITRLVMMTSEALDILYQYIACNNGEDKTDPKEIKPSKDFDIDGEFDNWPRRGCCPCGKKRKMDKEELKREIIFLVNLVYDIKSDLAYIKTKMGNKDQK